MSFLSLSPAASAPFRLFVRHGKYVQFWVLGLCGVLQVRHISNSCMEMLMMAMCLYCNSNLLELFCMGWRCRQRKGCCTAWKAHSAACFCLHRTGDMSWLTGKGS